MQTTKDKSLEFIKSVLNAVLQYSLYTQNMFR